MGRRIADQKRDSIRQLLIQRRQDTGLRGCYWRDIAVRAGVSESTVRRIWREMEREAMDTNPSTLPEAQVKESNPLRRFIRWLCPWLVLVLCCTVSAQEPTPAPPVPPVGTMFATRNLDIPGEPDENPSPGHWNHIGVMAPNGWVIEAQADHGVIAVPWATFYNRYPEILAFRPRQYPAELGPAVASAAAAQMGREYKLLGNNCTSVARRAVEFVTRDRPRWRRPDHVVADAEMIYWLKQQPDMVPIADFYAGETKNPNDVMGGGR